MMYGLERIVLNMRHTVRSWGTMVSVDQPKWNPLPADTGIIVLIFFLSFVFHYCHQWEIIYFSAQLLVLFPKDQFKKPLLSTSGRLRKIRPVVERMVWMVESHPVPKRFLRKNTTLQWCTCYIFESTNDMLSIETSLLSWEGRHSPLCVDEKF